MMCADKVHKKPREKLPDKPKSAAQLFAQDAVDDQVLAQSSNFPMVDVKKLRRQTQKVVMSDSLQDWQDGKVAEEVVAKFVEKEAGTYIVQVISCVSMHSLLHEVLVLWADAQTLRHMVLVMTLMWCCVSDVSTSCHMQKINCVTPRKWSRGIKLTPTIYWYLMEMVLLSGNVQ